jgi:hypothetical protein
MIHPDVTNTFSALDNGAIGPTNQLNRTGLRQIRTVLFWIFTGFGFFIALSTPQFSFIVHCALIGGFALVGLYIYFSSNETKWVEIDRVNRQCIIYKDKSRKKIIRVFPEGTYSIRHKSLFVTNTVNDYFIIVHAADDPEAKKKYYPLIKFPFQTKEEDVREFTRQLVSAINNYLDNKPYDRSFIRDVQKKR